VEEGNGGWLTGKPQSEKDECCLGLLLVNAPAAGANSV